MRVWFQMKEKYHEFKEFEEKIEKENDNNIIYI